jgi:protein SCO1
MKHFVFLLLAVVFTLSCRAGPGIQAGAETSWIAGQARNDKVILEQHPGASVPLDTLLRDDHGRIVHLRDYFVGPEPVLLVPGYYHCEELCGLLMHGLLESLQQSGVPRADWRIVRVSMAPDDTPSDAIQRRALDAAYADFLQGAEVESTPLHLDLLLADPPAAHAIGQAIGWSWQALAPRDDQPAPHRTEYAHPATVVVLTPQGRVARYLNGVRFDPQEVRGALHDASSGRIGGISDQLALLCAHLVPSFGRHTVAVMDGVRAIGLLVLLALAGFAWRHRPRREAA